MPNFDSVLILGDFNIHVCCPSKPLVSEFMHLVESFNLTQFVAGPTHKLGHTLDLVLSCGSPIWKQLMPVYQIIVLWYLIHFCLSYQQILISLLAALATLTLQLPISSPRPS